MRNRDLAAKWKPTVQKEPKHGRQCLYQGCGRWALEASPYCDQHIITREGVQLQREIIQSAKYLVDEDAMTAEAAREREEKRLAFERRVRRGNFNALLGAAMNKLLDSAKEQEAHDRQIAMMRFAMVKSLALEDDPHRLALALARSSNAISKAEMTRYLTQDPKPVVRFGQPWSPPLPEEDLVKYIWRHRPSDFEERYMAKIEEGSEFPANLFDPIKRDHQSTSNYDRVADADGKLLPPPMPVDRLQEIDARAGIEREYAEKDWHGKWVPMMNEDERREWDEHQQRQALQAEQIANGELDPHDLPF